MKTYKILRQYETAKELYADTMVREQYADYDSVKDKHQRLMENRRYFEFVAGMVVQQARTAIANPIAVEIYRSLDSGAVFVAKVSPHRSMHDGPFAFVTHSEKKRTLSFGSYAIPNTVANRKTMGGAGGIYTNASF